MPVIAKDKDDIEALIKDGHNLAAIAAMPKYDVARNTLKNFCAKHKIAYTSNKSTNSAKNSNIQQKTYGLGDLNHATMNPNTPLNNSFIPLPQSSDPAMLQYFLQLETNRAHSAIDALQALEKKFSDLKERYDDLRLEKKEFEREKRIAVEDAEKGAGFDATKFIGNLKDLPPELMSGLGTGIGSLLSGLSGKIFSPGTSQASAGLGSIGNSDVSDLVSYLKQETDPNKIREVCTVAYTLLNDPVFLKELMVVIKARSEQ